MKAGIATSVGVFRAEFRSGRLVALHFPDHRRRAVASKEPVARELARQLAGYLGGTRRRFDIEVDLSAGTEFQREVWRAIARIPFGKTKSYGAIAREIGKPGAARAVGSACGRNPIPVIVPCHRVRAGHNRLGGFSGGLAWKRRLLALEGVLFVENARGASPWR